MHLANLKEVLKSEIRNELQVTRQPRVHTQSERLKTGWSWSCPPTPGK